MSRGGGGREYGRWGRCEAWARSTGERCRQEAMGPHGKCYFHGGASAGPRDPSALEGNRNAAGNRGGGAAELNTNAVKHGAFSDLELVDERLEGEALAYVNRLTECLASRAAEKVPSMGVLERWELAREWALLSHQWGLAMADAYERGLIDEVEKSYTDGAGEEWSFTRSRVVPTLERSFEISGRQDEIEEELRLFPSMAPADADIDGGEA